MSSSKHAYRSSFAVGRSIQLYLADQFRSLEKTAPGLDADDPAVVAEAVHDLRVTCQQMRSVLHGFAGFLPAEPVARLDKRIRRLQRRFSDVRDRQILLEQPELIPALRRLLEREQAEALACLREDMDSRQLCRKVERLCVNVMDEQMEVRLSPEPMTRKGVVQLRRLDAVIPAVLYRLVAAITAYRDFMPQSLEGGSMAVGPVAGGDAFNGSADASASHGKALDLDRFWENPAWPSPVVLHRLRLSWKHLRHVLMMLCAVWGDIGNGLIDMCKGMQDQLGQLHDRHILTEALLRHVALEPDDRPAAAAVWPGLKRARQDLLEAFLAQWRELDMLWFQGQLQPLVEWSAQQAAQGERPCETPQLPVEQPKPDDMERPRPEDRLRPIGTSEHQEIHAGDMRGNLSGPSLDDDPERDTRLAAVYGEDTDDWPD